MAIKNIPVGTREQRLKELQEQVTKLYTKLEKTKKAEGVVSESITVRATETQARFKKVRNLTEFNLGIGEFFLLVDITAIKDTVYVPISIASGKKPTGFVYQIEGTAVGEIVTADISCKGEGISQVTLGTLLYAKIPTGTTATFRISIEIRGTLGKEYKIVINRINYKQNLNDFRYQKSPQQLPTKTVRFH